MLLEAVKGSDQKYKKQESGNKRLLLFVCNMKSHHKSQLCWSFWLSCHAVESTYPLLVLQQLLRLVLIQLLGAVRSVSTAAKQIQT